ncbi:MAG TPA: class I SAM-dependent methyltransferase [Methanomicrobia archaeon]|nr:class I SAM-dependent methyltransferase [Methanomicrobia archaeon]
MEEDERGIIERAAILRRWNVRGKHLLDLGAGPLAIIAAREFDCRVTTVDVSEVAVREARCEVEREGLSDKIIVEQADATALPYLSGRFEVVIGFGILHHIEPLKRLRLLREAARVASEAVILAELNAAGFKKIHEFKDYTPVDLAWLEQALQTFGAVESCEGRLMNVYVLSLRSLD